MTQGGHPKDFDEEDTCLLEQAVEKLVRFGQQVGVTPEEMISCLILESASALCTGPHLSCLLSSTSASICKPHRDVSGEESLAGR
jgi:hypothetical protein